MGKRTLAKRISRALQAKFREFKKKVAIAQEYNKVKAKEKAGEEIWAQVAACSRKEAGLDCVCYQAKQHLEKVQAACSYQKLQIMKQDLATFFKKIRSPLDLEMGEVLPWLLVIPVMMVLYYIGVSIGRWDVFGYKYDDGSASIFPLGATPKGFYRPLKPYN